MFTGLIQQIGTLARKETAGNAFRLFISGPEWERPLAMGESIAVNGVCLTVSRITGREFACDVLRETIIRSNLGAKPAGAPLNLERALRLGDALGGHLIAGHVEGLGTLVRRTAFGTDWILEFTCPADLLRQVVAKGSIACDGISLTVAELGEKSFSVNVIPWTWRNTTLRRLHEGDTVNLETDLIGKYVIRRLEQKKEGGQITLDLLRNAGFLDGDEAGNP